MSVVAAKPAAWVQRYLNALGYALKVDGNWNSATESAYRTVFGQSSGRYTEPRYYRVRTKTEEKKENSSQEKPVYGGRAGGITAVSGSGE